MSTTEHGIVTKLARTGLAAALCALTSASLGAQELTTEMFADGFTNPIGLRQPPGEQRFFVLETGLGVRVLDNGVLQSELYLDLRDEVSGADEKVLGFEFHPDYVNNGRMWVSYMDEDEMSHVVEYQRDASDPNKADESTAVHLFGPTQQPSNIHNWYDMHFGPDGMLYLGFGDGGGANDPNAYGQDLTVTFGKILRVDVNTGVPGTYAIPPDNPFVGTPGLAAEIWHYGVRSPWRFSFDRDTGDFWLGDVGQGSWEEISLAPAGSSALNFGWSCMEGMHCTGLSGCGCGNPNWVAPVVEYPHDNRCAVIGGYIYRGDDLPWLDGTYFYGDFCSGRIFSFEFDGTNVSNHVERTAELAPSSGSIGPIMSFGEDAEGELYIVEGFGGEIWKIVEKPCDPAPNYCQTTPNSVGSGALISTAGCPSISENDFRLTASQLPPMQFGLFFYGDQQTDVPFGQGRLCVSGTTGVSRLKPAIPSDQSGTIERHLDFTVPPASQGVSLITPGSTWHFQFWYRDPGLGFNLTNAVQVAFQP